jgi:stage II sporulation protein AA (anti-sigma F factor antagonist)
VAGLKYSSAKKGSVITITVGGSLDATSAPGFEKKLADELAKKPKILVVSMENLEYIASAGMGTLINANEEMSKAGGELRLAALTTKVEKIIKMLGFANFFTMYPTVQKAQTE